MKINQVFNTKGNDDFEHRRVWYGNPTNLMQLNDVKYNWALGLYQQMRDNFWIPQRSDITTDVTDYNNLTTAEKRAYNGILSYLTFLDSVQTCNLPHLKAPITAPEVSLCLAEQISQEAMHNHSYQYIIETIIPQEDRTSVYELWRTDKVLENRCKFIAHCYQDYLDLGTDHSYFVSLVANYILEGIYFYNGFIFFYNLASRLLMPGSSDIFRLINRDELSHVRLHQSLIREFRENFPGTFSDDLVHDLFNTAVEQEIKWTNHIVGDDVLGITSSSTDRFTKYLANIRLGAVGLEPLYSGDEYKKSPYAHLERFSDTKGDANTKSNFFDSNVTSYSMSSSIQGWDDI